jgi:hypothetical protein
MGAKQTFREVTLDAGATWSMDYCLGCDVTVSDDGSTWGNPIAKANGSGQVTTVTLTSPASARYIRITMNSGATSTTHWWSIAEFNALN